MICHLHTCIKFIFETSKKFSIYSKPTNFLRQIKKLSQNVFTITQEMSLDKESLSILHSVQN